MQRESRSVFDDVETKRENTQQSVLFYFYFVLCVGVEETPFFSFHFALGFHHN